MEDEIRNFIIIWLQVITCLCYCYVIGKIVPKGFPTLLVILPIVFFFLILPLRLHTLHLGGLFAFFITWLANSKLLLFAFNKGPLSNPSLSLKHFLVIASFPIKIHSPKKTITSPRHKSIFNYITKLLILIGVIKTYMFRHYIPPLILHSLYCTHLYLTVEFILDIISKLVQTVLGIQLEPHFDEPYLSTSLQDFWGRRWNLATSNILHLTVFEPTRRVLLHVIGHKQAALFSIFITFVASGLIHELIFYYLCRVRPTFEITCFFLLHGLCLIAELLCKNKLTAKLKLPRVLSGPLTLAFVVVTAFKLFFPQLLRCNSDQRVLQELAVVGAFVKNVTPTFTFNS